MVTNLVAPSPSRASSWARSISTSSSARLKSTRTGSSASSIGAWRAAPVATISSVSLVEVSPSTVTQFSDLSAASASSFCSTAPGTLASVKTKASIVAMSGRDHARALEEAVDGDGPLADLGLARGELGEGVGRHDGGGGGGPGVLARRLDEAGHDGRDLLPVERLADHAGRGHEHFVARAAQRLGDRPGALLDRLVAELAGEGIGVAGIDDDGADLAARRDSCGTSRPAPTSVFERVSTPAMVAPAGTTASMTSSRSL